VGTLIIKDVMFTATSGLMPAEYLPSFTQAPVLHRCTADTRLAKMRWDVGHRWCPGIYLERHAGCFRG